MAITCETVQIETFDQIEVTDAENPPPDADTLALCESLGLAGQTKMFAKTDDGKTVRSPFREMTKVEFNVYRALCPERKGVAEYDGSPIPRRVVEIYKKAKDGHFIEKVEVWSAESAEIKDPVLVGIIGPHRYSEKYYLLARWGAELLPFEELAAKAKSMVERRTTAAITAVRGECNRIEALIKIGAVDLAWKKPELSDVDRMWD